MQAMSRAQVYVSGVPRHQFSPHNYSLPPFIFANVQRLCYPLTRLDALFEQKHYDVSIFPKLKTVWASSVAPAETQSNLTYPGDLLSYIAECLSDDQGPERLAHSGRLFSKFQHFIDTQAERQGYPTQSFFRTVDFLRQSELTVRSYHEFRFRVLTTKAGLGLDTEKAGLCDRVYNAVSRT